MQWYLKAIEQYADFHGRARRKEYWMFLLFNLSIAFVMVFIEGMLGTKGMLGLIYSLMLLVPGFSVTTRRLHDVDKSGWWSLIALIPLLGALILTYYLACQGTNGSNRFGPDPKISHS